MMTPAFDRLLYTNCPAGVGRGAGGGFQVQAQSAGVDPLQSRMVRDRLLYEVQEEWAGREEESFPLGLAHACDEGLGTAQGRYVGSGARSGNHVTDCLLTRDSTLYGPTRPAQLWRSNLWRSERWDTTECPQYTDVLEPGPLTVETVAAWTRQDPERSASLAKLLSVLEDPAGRQVVLVAGGPDEALRWITAATLLLPMYAALGTSFKVYVTNPQRASHRVVAVPKELYRDVHAMAKGSWFVLDTETSTSGEAPVSERAVFWVERLAAAQDPYDVIDAVELAPRLVSSSATGAVMLNACHAAWAITVPDETLVEPAAVVRWLMAAEPAALAQHGPAAVELLLAGELGAAVLRWIDSAAAADALDVDRVLVRTRLLAAEIVDARRGVAAPAQELPPVALTGRNHRDADSNVSSAILLSPDAEVDLLLRIANRHAATLTWAPLQARLQSFVATWIKDLPHTYRPQQWALREEILDLAHDKLEQRCTQRGIEAVIPVVRNLWRYYTHRQGDPGDPLDVHLAVAAAAAMPVDRRAKQMAAILAATLRSPKTAAMAIEVQRAAVTWRAVGPREAMELVANLPDEVALYPQLADAATREAERRAPQPDALVLNVVWALHQRNALRSSSRCASLLEAEQAVQATLAALDSVRAVSDLDGAAVRRAVAELRRADECVVRVRLADLLRAVLDCQVAQAGAVVLRALSAPAVVELVKLWAATLRGPQSVHAAVCGVAWVDDQKLPNDVASQLTVGMQGTAAGWGPADREQWRVAVERRLGGRYAKRWATIMPAEGARAHRRRGGRQGSVR